LRTTLRSKADKDIDFLGVNVSSERKELEKIIRAIASIKVDDG